MHFSQILGTRHDRIPKNKRVDRSAQSHRNVGGERSPETQPDQRDLRGPGCIHSSSMAEWMSVSQPLRSPAVVSPAELPVPKVVEAQRMNAVDSEHLRQLSHRPVGVDILGAPGMTQHDGAAGLGAAAPLRRCPRVVYPGCRSRTGSSVAHQRCLRQPRGGGDLAQVLEEQDAGLQATSRPRLDLGDDPQ